MLPAAGDHDDDHRGIDPVHDAAAQRVQLYFARRWGDSGLSRNGVGGHGVISVCRGGGQHRNQQ